MSLVIRGPPQAPLRFYGGGSMATLHLKLECRWSQDMGKKKRHSLGGGRVSCSKVVFWVVSKYKILGRVGLGEGATRSQPKRKKISPCHLPDHPLPVLEGMVSGEKIPSSFWLDDQMPVEIGIIYTIDLASLGTQITIWMALWKNF